MTYPTLNTLYGDKRLLDPAFLDLILKDCSNRVSGSIRKGNITSVALLLILPEQDLIDNLVSFGKQCAATLGSVLKKHSYTLGQASSLLLDYQKFFGNHGYRTLRSVFQADKNSAKFTEFSAALRQQLAEWYKIPLAPNNISLDILLPAEIGKRLEENSDLLLHFTGFCRDAFEDTVRAYILSEKPSQPLKKLPNKNDPLRPVHVTFTLREEWGRMFQREFLENVAQELQESPVFRGWIIEEYTLTK